MARADVAVIGAGVAGMTAAVALALRGREVVLVDQFDVLGGRASAETDAETGVAIDRGVHVFLRSYTSTLRWLSAIGAAHRIAWTPARAAHLVHEADGYAVAPMRHVPGAASLLPSLVLDRALGLAGVLSSGAPMLRAVVAGDAHVREADAITGAGYLQRLGVTAGAIHRLWDPLARCMLGCGIAECSAGSLLRICGTLARGDLRIGIALDDLTSLVTAGVSRRVRQTGGTIVIGRRVTTVRRTPDARWDVVASRDLVCTANTVIVATPPEPARALLGDLGDRARIPRPATLHYACVSLWLASDPAGVPDACTIVPPAPALKRDVFVLSRLVPRPASDALVSSNHAFRGAIAPHDADLVRRAADDLRLVAGGSPPPAIVRARVTRIAAGSYVHAPGFEVSRPSQATPIPGLYLAGDWTDTGKPPSMESASRSGWLAAEHVLGAR